MSSTVWAVPAARVRDTYILRFLKDAKCSLRVVEVRLFKTSLLIDRVPDDRRPLRTSTAVPVHLDIAHSSGFGQTMQQTSQTIRRVLGGFTHFALLGVVVVRHRNRFRLALTTSLI